MSSPDEDRRAILPRSTEKFLAVLAAKQFDELRLQCGEGGLFAFAERAMR
jgi:hypothetical protein